MQFLGLKVVSILGMLEGVLKDYQLSNKRIRNIHVSILGMLEGVLKQGCPEDGDRSCINEVSISSWYVGGGC